MATLQKTSPGRYVMKDLYLFSYKRDTLEQKLQGLPIQIPLKKIRPDTALRRALALSLDQKRYTFEESSVEKIDKNPVYLILSREALSQEQVDPSVGKAYLDGNQLQVETPYPDIKNTIAEGFKYHMETAITRDLSIIVTKYLVACMGIPVRPKNGEIYFVLEKYVPQVLDLMNVIDSLGQESTIRVSPVVGEEVQKVLERAHDHFRAAVEDLQQLTEEISEETHTKTLNTRLKDARELLEQARAYEIGLGMELEEVTKKISEAQEKITERLMGKQTARSASRPDLSPAELPSKAKELSFNFN